MIPTRCLPLLLTLSTAAAAQRPHVLFLCIDDLKPEFGAYGAHHIHAPNLDRLAAESVRFERAYTQQAVCAPSRMSTFTGLRPDSTRVWDLATDLRTVTPSAMTLQQYFKQHGYRTLGTGKVMHGSANEDPLSWSEPFVHDEDLPYAKGFAAPVTGQYQNPAVHQALASMDPKTARMPRKRKQALENQGLLKPTENLDVPDDAYADGAITAWAVRQLRAASSTDTPLFLTLGFHKPHLPFVAPQRYWDLYRREDIRLPERPLPPKGAPEYAPSSWGELRNYSGIPKGYAEDITDEQKRELIHGYYACVSYIDAQIGQVLDALKANGLADNTLVILWGDHGWHLGDHGLWCKHTNFEQATRIPLMIRAPGQSPAVVPGVVESLDLFPTICELAGLPVPAFTQGRSLAAVVRAETTETKDFAIHQYPRSHKNYMGYALRTRDHRLVWWMKDDFRATDHDFDPARIAATELYDYHQDPLETRNLADDPAFADVKSKMESWLRAFFAEQRASTAKRNALTTP